MHAQHRAVECILTDRDAVCINYAGVIEHIVEMDIPSDYVIAVDEIDSFLESEFLSPLVEKAS
jgi:hypothetical protein